MNYPDGMTREDWKHIDGFTHFEDCPFHEDNDKTVIDLVNALENVTYLLQRYVGDDDSGFHHIAEVNARISETRRTIREYKLYCTCDEIAEDNRIDAALAKWEEERFN